MATYKGAEAFDYSRINGNRRPQAGSTAPKIVQLPLGEPQQQQKPKVVKKTRKQLKAETKRANLRAMKALSVAVVLLCFVGIIIFSRIQLDEVSRDISNKKAKLTALQSDNTDLEMKINSMVSLDKVEEYAKDKLGMVKQEGYQVEYVNLSGSDKVLLSGGEKVKNNNSEKTKDELSNISKKK